MAVVNVADMIEVQIVGSLSGQTTRGVLHYTVTSITGAPQEQLPVFTTFDASLRASGKPINAYQNFAPNNWASAVRTYQVIAPTRVLRTTIAFNVIGSQLSPAVTPNVAGVVTKYGALANRHNIGSIHIPAPGLAGNATDGVWNPAQQALLQVVALSLPMDITVVTGGVTYTMSPILFNRRQPLNPSPIVAATNRPTVRVMRRRTVGVGE